MTAAEIPGTWGYGDRFSVRAGESLKLMMSSTAQVVSASVVRLGTLDYSHGVQSVTRPVEELSPLTLQGGTHALNPGSYVSVALKGSAGIDVSGGFTFTCWLYPTAPSSQAQWVIRVRTGVPGVTAGLGITKDGPLFGCGESYLRSDVAVPTEEWSFLGASWDSAKRRASLVQVPLREWVGQPRFRIEAIVEWSVTRFVDELRMGSGFREHNGSSLSEGFFNGKIDEPSVFARALSEVELERLASGAEPVGMEGVEGTWSFLPTRPSGVATDRSHSHHDGTCVNLPTACVTGHRWRGTRVNWQAAPLEYSALALHEDDLEDAEWPVAADLATLPTLPSGIYAAHLVGDDGSTDDVPFFIRARAPNSDVLFLVPTFTYLAYANEHWTWSHPAVDVAYDVSSHLSQADRYAAANRLLSLYDHHVDDSGVCYASRLRPLVNIRPDYVSAIVRGRRELSADLFLTDWLERVHPNYDVATDDDLHDEGSRLLEPYRVVVTGSHPEYYSERMLDGIGAYVGRGGRLMYLGGNGFYWVTTVGPDRPHVIEVRRGHAGTGTWRSAPGEVDHSHTGEPGGLWRHRGRPPQTLVGVGMTAVGLGQARPYLRSASSYQPRVGWISMVSDRNRSAYGATYWVEPQASRSTVLTNDWGPRATRSWLPLPTGLMILIRVWSRTSWRVILAREVAFVPPCGRT